MTLSTNFDEQYLRTWTETDPERRRAVIDELWSPTGTLSVSSVGITLTGTDDITAHITRVHDDLIAGKGLAFSYDQRVESGDALLLRWSMTAPNGTVVGRGVDVVFADASGRIDAVHMFMGIE